VSCLLCNNTFNTQNNYLFCPHSSIGSVAPSHCGLDAATTVVLATAHPAKFPAAVSKAVDPLPAAPDALQQLYSMPTRKHEIVNSLEAVKQYLLQTLEGTAEAVSTKDSNGSVTAAASVTGATNAAPALAATESDRIAAMTPTPTATTSKLSATADVWQPKASDKAGLNNSVPVPTTTTATAVNNGEHTLCVSANTEGIAAMNGSSANGVGSSVNSSSNGVSYNAEIAAAADKIAVKDDENKSLRLLTLSVFVGVVVVVAAVTLRSRR
jgi:hypothetical protein